MKKLEVTYKDDTIERFNIKIEPDFVNNFLLIKTTKNIHILIPNEAIKRIELQL